MPIRSSRPHTIREFVDTLEPGARVIWVANGTAGTVQPDRTILWDNGHHLTRRQMKEHHALLIHSEAEKKQLQLALANRLKCLKKGCTLVHWDDEGYNEQLPERLCPLAVLTEPAPRRRSTAAPHPSTARAAAAAHQSPSA